MTLNQRPSKSWLAKAARFFGKGLAGVSLLAAAGGVTAGCLNRPVTPATPQTTNVYISQIRQTGVDKIDLLFMIDNSISMSDKQQILAQAVPVLVQRLITPACVDEEGMPVGGNADPTNGICQNGVAEFKPIKNIHIGVITSSLGDHGSNDVCSQAQNDANQAAPGGRKSFYNDLAQLLPSIRAAGDPNVPDTGLYSWNNSGFLVWDPRDYKQGILDKHSPPPGMNETDAAAFNTAFTNMVVAAGEYGCGYEAQLEAWYRFLVDPEPVTVLSNDGGNSIRGMINGAVLAQRAAFMRHDSLLAVVMLTDENDCSIIDEDGYQGWLVGWKGGVGKNSWRMPRASAACANPNDPCCRPCSSGAPAGCMPNEQDPSCSISDTLGLNDDSMNERCFVQLKRFGIDLLYPTSRYVDGLAQKFITPRFGGQQVPNPIYAPSAKGEPAREPELVFLAGLIGVPWQDVSTEASWQGRGLTYMKADELRDAGRWDVILGDPAKGVAPSDPMMIESIEPRPTGAVHPLLGMQAAVVAPGGAANNPINGREQVATGTKDDLQFACIFDLNPVKSAADCEANADGCDCNADEAEKDSPLCMGTTVDATGSQIKAKGYPGVRELQVLKDYGSNSIVASICPKNVMAQGGDPKADPDYGYNPAVAAIVDRLKEALTVKCLPRPLTVNTPENSEPMDVGKVPCAVVEVRPMVDNACPDPMCALPGRALLEGDRQKIIPAAREFLRNEGVCGGAALSCDSYCFCELEQFTGAELRACQMGDESADQAGYCYVDPDAARKATPDDAALIAGEENLVKDCSSTQKRILRFIGENVPAKDGLAFIACIGAAAED